jgi:hypothetical protein
MTERKPSGQPWESWIDRQLRERMEAGEFADLPGAGQPLPDLGQPNDEAWWIKQKLRREGLSLLPPALELRRDVAAATARIAAAASEDEVRRRVAEINACIVAANRGTVAGPATTLAPLDPEQEVTRWREGRG